MSSILGTGSIQDPIRRSTGCAVLGCGNTGPFVRITNTGHAVQYCRTHSTEASEMFDRDLDLDPYAVPEDGDV